MSRLLSSLLALLICSHLNAQTTLITGPSGSESFGENVTLLPNGNYVVTDPYYDNGPFENAGAVYLYDGTTLAPISVLAGSNNSDLVGLNGIIVLSNSNFVVVSPYWAGSRGAVTWCNGMTGRSGLVSSANSLVGGLPNDQIGWGGVTPLTNGHYVVSSPHWRPNNLSQNFGAATWCDGSTGATGLVSATNSLVGNWHGDLVGYGGVKALTNGNYVVSSPYWDNGSAANAGAVTWGNGSSGITGIVTSANSLVGSTANDWVGDSSITPLPNGNYVVNSPNWANSAGVLRVGAVTWGDGSTGISGAVSALNSLIGSNYYDRIGYGGIVVLTNGNYLVNSYMSGPGTGTRGAVTWGSGTAGVKGVVSAGNSLIGSTSGDQVGYKGITVLSNGNYVVCSPLWTNGSVNDAGAVTWGNGTTGVSGTISAANSLVGLRRSENIGSGGVTALTNGHYVISSPFWTKGYWYPACGAVTWANGTTGIKDTISIANSLVGNHPFVQVGSGGVIALSNGHYVVSSPEWSDTMRFNAGAVTWCNGTAPTINRVSDTNSLVGTQDDLVGIGGVIALTNGHYVVKSEYWNNGAAERAGAITWCRGTGITSMTVSASNSLVGSTTDDQLGRTFMSDAGITPLANGNYVVSSSTWDNGGITDAGAVTWADGSTGVSGPVSAANSVVGTTADDLVGTMAVTALPDGNYTFSSIFWDNGAIGSAGAVTWGNGSTGVRGPITSCNSVTGLVAAFLALETSLYDSARHRLVVGKPLETAVAFYRPTGQGLATSTTSSSYYLTGSTAAPFIGGSCRLIASLAPSGPNPVSGNISSTVYIAGGVLNHSGQTLVRRHYDITPATGADSATARLTLYYSQPDFDDYNNNNGTGRDLPSGPSDTAGISALRIMQFHGTSSSGAPGSYSGWSGSGPAIVTIDPADSNIIWNGGESRWEVSFDVAGFSGFFAFSESGLDADGITAAHDVQVAPVPATSHVRVSYSDPMLTGTEAIITDLHGREIYRFRMAPDSRVSIKAWPAGIYMLKLQSGRVYRIVKQ